MRRTRLTVLLAGLAVGGLALVGATLLAPAGALADDNPLAHLPNDVQAPPPSVISYSGSSAGFEFHLVPGQYHPTFDQAFVESFPYASSAADSTPSARATATPAELGLFLDNYPTGACLISTFSPYCNYIQKFPVDTYFARATSDSERTRDARTDFPCAPGAPQPKTVAVPVPACQSSPPKEVSIGDGTAHADPAPAASGVAHLAAFQLTAPGPARAAYRARLQRAHDLLSLVHRPTAGVDRAMADMVLLSTSGITVASSYVTGGDGLPRAHNQVTFGSIDALGGLVHADGLVLDLVSGTLGQVPPPVKSETARFLNLVVAGYALGNVDTTDCNSVTGQVNNAAPSQLPGGQQFSLGAFGFHLSCSVDSSSVITDPSKGYGLNPVSQELTGPGLDFVQMQNPLDYLAAAGVPIPQACYPSKDLPPPPALPAPPKPLPPPPGPTSTCQFLSTNSFANNGFSVHLGHVMQTLAAQPPVSGDLGAFGSEGGYGALGGPSTGSPLNVGVGGSSAGLSYPRGTTAPIPGTTASTPTKQRLVLAGVPYRDWLIFGYGAWGCAVLAALCLWALAIHRRRLAGIL